jgi:RimJ/RimL family protein N-acetyltransferase
MFIRSRKTILRPLLEADLPTLLMWANDPDLQQYFSVHLPKMEDTEKRWLEKMSRQMEDMEGFVFMVETLEGTPIGTMALHSINWQHRFATTGAAIVSKDHRGQGYGSTTKMHLLNFAFNDLNMNRVNSRVLATNPRSIRYSERCGYRIEGRLRQAFFKNGRYVDEVIMGVLRKDWTPLWKKYQETGNLK